MKGTVEEHPNFIWRSTTLHNPDHGPEGDRIIRENLTLKQLNLIKE
jgi:hypothetical protein